MIKTMMQCLLAAGLLAAPLRAQENAAPPAKGAPVTAAESFRYVTRDESRPKLEGLEARIRRTLESVGYIVKSSGIEFEEANETYKLQIEYAAPLGMKGFKWLQDYRNSAKSLWQARAAMSRRVAELRRGGYAVLDCDAFYEEGYYDGGGMYFGNHFVWWIHYVPPPEPVR